MTLPQLTYVIIFGIICIIGICFLFSFKKAVKVDKIASGISEGGLIEKGQRWILRDGNDGPWPRERPTVEILDVKEGWIRYSIGGVFTDERLIESSFRGCYRRVS